MDTIAIKMFGYFAPKRYKELKVMITDNQQHAETEGWAFYPNGVTNPTARFFEVTVMGVPFKTEFAMGLEFAPKVQCSDIEQAYKDLLDGTQLVLPCNEAHAKAMMAIGESYLNRMKEQQKNETTKEKNEP